MNEKFEWELIFKSEDKITETFRAKVPGGWIVKDFNCIYTDSVEDLAVLDKEPLKSHIRRYTTCVGLTYIPDLNHEWEKG